MIRFYQLLFTTLSLLSCLANIEASLSPRAGTPPTLPGSSFVESLSPAFKVTPFKVSSRGHGHGHGGLHQTLDAVKRMVEDHGNMVEVPEEALEDLLDQIKRLQDQVTEMLPQDANDQPGGQSSDQSGGVPGRISSGNPSGDSPGETSESASVQGLSLRSSVSTASTVGVAASSNTALSSSIAVSSGTAVLSSSTVSVGIAGETAGAGSDRTSVLVVSDGGDGSESPQETKLPESVSPESSIDQHSLSKESGLQVQTASNQPTTARAVESTGASATSAINGRVSRSSEPITTSQDGRTGSPTSTVENSPTSVPGGAFKESLAAQIDESVTQDIETIYFTASSNEGSDSSHVSDHTRSQCEIEGQVSGQPVLRRNADCTWTDKSTAEEATAEDSLPTSTETAAVLESSDIAVATLLSSATSPAVSYTESTVKVTLTTQVIEGLTTLVFTSVLTRTVTLTATTTTTDTSLTYFEPTDAPASVSGLVFKELEEEEEGEEEEGENSNTSDGGRRLAIDQDGRLVMKGDDSLDRRVTSTKTWQTEPARQSTMSKPSSLSLAEVETTGLSTNLPTSSSQLDDERTSASAPNGPGPSARPMAIFKEAGANMTYHSPMPSGFKTVTKGVNSLVEGGGR